MATFQLNALTPSSSSSYPTHYSSSLYFLSLHLENHSSISSKSFKFNCNCSSDNTVHVNTQKSRVASKTRRKPRPSFYDQIQDKWSSKIPSQRQHLPWQVPDQNHPTQEEEEEEIEIEIEIEEKSELSLSPVFQSKNVTFGMVNRSISAPWVRVSEPRKTQIYSGKIRKESVEECENVNGVTRRIDQNVGRFGVENSNNFEKDDSFDKKLCDNTVKIDESQIGLLGNNNILPGNVNNGVFPKLGSLESGNGLGRRIDENTVRVGVEKSKNLQGNGNFDDEFEKDTLKIDETPLIRLLGNNNVFHGNSILPNEMRFGNDENGRGDDNGSSIGIPWIKEKQVKGVDKWMKSKTGVAEKSIPEHELKRLKNVALRMVERFKVGAAGVTQTLVDSVHEKWESDEVVKLKFEGISTLNMKRAHETLEKKTGGLVIWRSGNSIVLFRGMTYKLRCAQSYNKQNKGDIIVSQNPKDIKNVLMKTEVKDTTETDLPTSAKYLKDLSEEEIMDFNELNHLLDDLGPRFEDWSGRDPKPIDADLLPSVVPGYKTPFRVLPYGARKSLKNRQMTKFRRTARFMPPHFALGRSRELQGLAKAIAKLWERSAIVKIAIKRGVLNTLNDRMAEEIKRLTGGTLLSRNKDYIVFYRGNDFMPPAVTKALKERHLQTQLCQDEEELIRQNASGFIDLNAKSTKHPLVAGTLAETMAATSQWRNQSGQDAEKMIRESALAKHAALVRYLEKKLNFAKEKSKKVDRALSKVQKYLEPSELPTDLEVLGDEERFLFRKMGLSMKPFLLLGTRGIFDGTIENVHLHWKYRELVKIIVKGKNFAQVKHIAISLEAESGGVLVSVDKTTKGYAIIVYRGKNYLRPNAIRPRNLLTRRQALARSIELQRREALKHHVMDLEEQIELLKSDLEKVKSSEEVDVKILKSRFDTDIMTIEEDAEEDEGEEAYLDTYDSSDEESNAKDE